MYPAPLCISPVVAAEECYRHTRLDWVVSVAAVLAPIPYKASPPWRTLVAVVAVVAVCPSSMVVTVAQASSSFDTC